MRKIIEDNNAVVDGTFFNKLKFKNEFDENLLIEFINEVAKQGVEYKNCEPKRVEFLPIVFNLYGYLNHIVISVLNNTNPFFTDNDYYVNNYRLIELHERFRDVFFLLLKNDIQAILSYEDEIGCLEV